MKALLKRIRQILRDRRVRKFFTRFVSTIAAIVVFVTTYALILPAITLEKVTVCGIEEHQHDTSCYEDVLTCGLEESDGHKHDDSCYKVVRDLLCEISEHEHGQECYDENGELICTISEHIHGEKCYKEYRELTCGITESEGHHHDASCYKKVLTCGKEIHVHSTACYHSDAESETATEDAATAGTKSSASAGAGTASTARGTANADASDGTADASSVGSAAASTGAVDGKTGRDAGENHGSTESVNAGRKVAADGSTGSDASAAATTNVMPEEVKEKLSDGYVPQLDPVDMEAVLGKNTGFYYYDASAAAENGQDVPADSSAITDWKKYKDDDVLEAADILRLYLPYTIPAGTLNSTNQIARYRLPGNIRLDDAQIVAINETENGLAGSFVNYDTLEITDPDKYEYYRGAEAVEGTRRPDQDVKDYLYDLVKHGGSGEEYISAVVKAENVFDEKTGDYLGQDLIFIFTPYTIEKNQNEYDTTGKPVKAGEKITGWFACDFNCSQIDWVDADDTDDAGEDETGTGKKAADVVLVNENKDASIKEISETLILADRGADLKNGQADAASTDIAVDDAAEAKTEAGAEEAADTATDADSTSSAQNQKSKDVDQSDQTSGSAGTAEEASTTEEDNEQPAYKSGTLTAAGDSYKIALDYTAEAQIPANAGLQVTEITAESNPEAYEACLEEARKQVVADDNDKTTVDAAATRFFDIEIVVEEEGQQKKIEPSAPVAVNIQLAEKKDTDKEEDSKGRENTGEDNKGKSNSDAASAAKSTDSTQDPTVLHFTEEGVEHIEAETSVNETKKDVATKIQFETESFSIYGVVYTVDFHWEVNGQTYEYRLDGGDTVSFRELLRALHILDEEDDVDKFLAEIETIQFSDESLVKVVQITEGITAGALKQKWDLEPEYAAGLTEAQIAQSNEKVFYAPDWALVSMKAFDTEEYLTVTMQTGEQFRIQVTDAQLTKKVISAGGETYEITVTYDDSAEIPDGAELTAEEILPEDENYAEYYGKAVDALKGIEKGETASQSEITGETYARFFDISIMDGGEKVEPKAAVNVDIQLADAVETNDAWSVVHFEADRPVIMESEAVLSDKTDAVEMVFETDGFSVYGVITVPSAQPDPAINDLEGRSFTISHDSRYVTTNITPIENGNNTYGFGKTTSSAQAATWYFERPSGSSGNIYYIYTLNGNNEKQYINLTRNNSNTDRANASLSANPQPFTVTRDGNIYRLAAQSNGTTYYLDEHNGDRGNAFAGWHGATDNGRLTLNFPSQPVMQNDGKYMALVKYEGKYYIVNNDCSLTEVEYDEATHKVAVDDPMLWTVNKNNPNGHIFFNSKEAGFTELLTASDWYRRYLDPSSARGYLEETNEPGAGHVDIDTGTWHYSQEADKWYMEHQITNRRNVENNTTVSIDNTSTGDSTLYNIYHGNKNGSNYLGVVVNADGTLRLAGQQSGSNAAEFAFASPTEVKDVYWTNHTVDHIDISIAGTAAVSVPLAYGNYYGSTAGDEEDPVLTVSDNRKVELSEAQMVDPSQLRITAEDMKRATITAARVDNGTPLNDAFYITGYSGNVANGTSNDQVRIEGSFMVADLRGTEYEYVDYNQYMNYATWDANQYTKNVNSARKNNIVEYTVTVVKPLTYKLIDPDLGQLYDAEGHPLTITVDVAFSASFNYWDSENECPAVNGATGFGGDAWQNGGIDPSNISGMDFVLGGDIEDYNSPLVALEITKVIMDQEGNRIELKTPVNNYFDIYEKKSATNAQKNGVQGLHVVDSLHHPEWESDPRDATIRDGYTFWRTKRLKVDDTGSAIVFDFDATDAMYYIVERHDEESLPETVTDKHDNTWTYINTYIETEYVRRDDENGTHDEYSNRTLHPSAMHTTEVFTREDGSYASIPEVAGKFTKLDGTPKKEGFLEFYVYNIYKQVETVDVPIDKTWYDEEGNVIDDEDPASQYTWSATFELEEREVHVSGPAIERANTTAWVPVDGVARKTITNQDSGSVHELARTFKDLPKYRYYYDEHGNESEYRIMYSVTETEYTLRKNGTMISHWDNVNGLDPASEVYYAPLFPHDAGDANDTSGIGENDPNFYHVIIENHLSEEITEDEIDLLISKKWDQDIELDENSFARFQLKRYKKTEYYEQEVDGNNIPVVDGEGNPVWNQSPGIEGPKEDIVFTNENHYYTLNENDEWSLPIDHLPKTTVFEKNGHKTVNHYSYYFEEIGSDPAGFYAVFKDSEGNTLSGDESHRIEETGTAVTAENHRTPLTKLYKVDISKIAGITSSDINTGDLLEGATFRVQRYNSFSPEHKDTTWGPNHDGTVAAVVDPDHDGAFSVSGLTPGLYEIDEMTYPAGYIQADNKPRFKIELNPATEKLEVFLLNSDGSAKAFNSNNGNVLVIGNTPGIALPSTGGLGTNRIYLAGIVLSVLAAVSMMIKSRRKSGA